jgi:hypothetical protein
MATTSSAPSLIGLPKALGFAFFERLRVRH